MDKKKIFIPLAGLLLLASCGKETGESEREPRKEGYRRPNIVMANHASGAKVWMDENGYTYLHYEEELFFNDSYYYTRPDNVVVSLAEDIQIPKADYLVGFPGSFIDECEPDDDDWNSPHKYRLDLYPEGKPIGIYYSRVYDYENYGGSSSWPNFDGRIPMVSISKPYNEVYTSESVQGETVVFQHLTAAIMVKFLNNIKYFDPATNTYKRYPVRVDSICVTSDRYPLNGWREVRLNADCSVTVTDVQETSVESRRSISVIPWRGDDFYNSVAIPIPPVKAPSTLNFTFYCTLTDPFDPTQTSRVELVRTATLNRDIVRNMQINATIELNQELTGIIYLKPYNDDLNTGEGFVNGGSI